MKKIFQRLAVFFIGLPLLLFVIVFFPWNKHLLLNVLVTVFSILGALEFRNILSRKDLPISIPETIILGALCPATMTLTVSFGFNQILPVVFVLGAFWCLVSRIFSNPKNFDSYLGQTIAGFAVMIYPGFFLSWIVLMADFNQAGMVILIFVLIALLNDAIAWATGVLFGKNNRGLVSASPKKSIAGFAGGLAASVATGISAVILIPAAFAPALIPPIPAGAILGFGAGLASTLGDLSESAIKRSADVKDSGSLILGRGGALDSVDSVALAAPIYYLLYQHLFVT